MEPKATYEITDHKAVQLYDGDMIRLLAGHIKRCVPNGGELTDGEALALAQASLATDLCPFSGEIWYIPKKGPHIGIRGLRRKAREQSLYSINVRPMTPEELQEHGVRIEIGDIGCACELYRHDQTREAADINRLAGAPIITIKPIIGIGIWRKAYPEINQYKDDPVPHSKSPSWVAKKRAEADALSQAFNIKTPYSDEVDSRVSIDEESEGPPIGEDNGDMPSPSNDMSPVDELFGTD